MPLGWPQARGRGWPPPCCKTLRIALLYCRMKGSQWRTDLYDSLRVGSLFFAYAVLHHPNGNMAFDRMEAMSTVRPDYESGHGLAHRKAVTPTTPGGFGGCLRRADSAPSRVLGKSYRLSSSHAPTSHRCGMKNSLCVNRPYAPGMAGSQRGGYAPGWPRRPLIACLRRAMRPLRGRG